MSEIDVKTGYMQRFNRRSNYLSLYRYYWGQTKQLILGTIRPGMTILDYGCGNGTIGLLGDDDEKQVCVDGIDTYDKGNLKAKYHYHDEVVKTDYDLILFSHAIEHMELNEAATILRWLRGHGKRIIMATPNGGNPSFDFWQDLTHKRKYSYPDTLTLMEDAGWHVEQVYFTNPGLKRTLPFRLALCKCFDCGTNGLFYEYVVVAR